MSLPDTWKRPSSADLSFDFRIGETVLVEFARAHEPAAILRELIQNEYDAGGSRLEVAFGNEGLTIKGNGQPVDQKGWLRLSVVMGTGRVGGTSEFVRPKANGIGEKNFGLRSLFVFGDELYVRSNGWQTVLHRERGSLPKPIPDEASQNSRGIEIFVPYRTKKSGRLDPFTHDAEAKVFERLTSSISLALLKLADVILPNSLREMVVSSSRHERTINWEQTVRRLASPARGVTLLSRRVQMVDSKGPDQTMEELEWQRSVTLPREFDVRLIPGYFRLLSRRVRFGVSLRTSKARLPPNSPAGIIYYPIGLPRLYTGNAVSLNAPFDMDFDRSLLNDPTNSAINSWLLERLAELTVSVLNEDWFKRFGANAYLAVGEISDSSIPAYTEALETNLRTSDSWAVRSTRSSRTASLAFATVTTLNVPADPRLDGFLSDAKYLHHRLANNPKVADLALQYGAKRFTLNSLVRLFCGDGPNKLKTKLADSESNYHYTNYPEALNDATLQVKILNCLDLLWPKLSSANHADLESSLLLSASGELRPADKLWCVPVEIQEACPLPPGDRLHPELVPFAKKRKLCKKFNSDEWVTDVARRAASDAANEDERMALYRFVLAVNGHFSPRTRAEVRRSPILRDHRRLWVSPSSITLANAAGAREIKAALHLPHREFARNIELAKALRFKRTITGEDLIAYARLITEEASLASVFERTLSRFKRLLTRKVVADLRKTPFLRSQDGSIQSPENLYARNPINLACAGPAASYAGGERTALYRLLGCKDRPDVEGMLEYLSSLSENGAGPPQPDRLYPELVKALERDGRSTGALSESEILWNGSGYSAPEITLVGGTSTKLFGNYLPCITSLTPVVRDAYIALGASARPHDQHWTQLLTSIGEEYLSTARPLSVERRNLIRAAYKGLKTAPIIPENVPWLLDRDGKLHLFSAVQSLNFLMDDEPALADALREASVEIAFADTSTPALLPFFHMLEVKALTDVRRRIHQTIGSPRSAPPWFNETALVRKLGGMTFLEAIETIALQDFGGWTGSREHFRAATRGLRSIRTIEFVETLMSKYRIHKSTVSLPVKAICKDGVIYLTYVKKLSEMNGLLAGLIAEEYLERINDQRSLSDAIYRLLTSDSETDRRDYLQARGIRLKSDPIDEQDDEDQAISEQEQFDEVVRSALVQSLVTTTTKSIRPVEPQISLEESNIKTDEDLRETFPLPSLEEVEPVISAPTPGWSKQKRTGISGGSGGWTRMDLQRNSEQDRAVGRRGEEIVLLVERIRVRELGFAEDRVRWIAKDFPTADYDILSVDDDGEDLVIEVKATTGTDGRFHWSRAEFQRALESRERYLLYRVFLATSCAPVVRAFRDPINILSIGSLRLDVEVLHGEVEPLLKGGQ
ncbi:MAG TPA: hypothetical protein DC054_24680 [Blastocatellia bacterium]|nr:hypothetical protein [Blastocatellia bacterium]